MLKNGLIIFLCSVFALEATFPDADMADLSRLPELFSHFQKHRAECPDLSFAEFLSLHYNDPGHFATAPADHQKLPFSKRQHHRVSFQIAPETVHFHSELSYIAIMKIEPANERIVLPSSIANQVWQPPRA